MKEEGLPEVISLGCGVQSSTMALMAAHREITPMPVAAIFADTGAEPEPVYEWLEWIRGANVLPFPVIQVQFSDMAKDIDRTLAGEVGIAGRMGGYMAAPFHTVNEDGSKGMLRRECTRNYKINPIESAIKKLLGIEGGAPRQGGPLIRQWIGISGDEYRRASPAGPPKWIERRFPLIDRMIGYRPPGEPGRWLTRTECLAWLERHEYPKPPRSACWMCPYRSDKEWRALREDSPADWAKAVALDARIRDAPARQLSGLREGGTLHLHRSGLPLDHADLTVDHPGLWDDECGGRCGT